MSILLLPVGSDGQAFNDANGAPRSGAKLFVYLANTSTKATIYQDEAGGTPHANPIVLNSSGQVANGSAAVKPIFADSGQTFDVVLAPSNDTDPPASPYFTLEDIALVNDAAIASITEWISGTTPTYVSATSFTVVGDQSSTYHVGRRVKTTNSGGTIYSSISAVAYTTLTTITVINDSGTFDSGLSAVSYGLLTATGSSIPGIEFSGLNWTFHGSILDSLSLESTDAGATVSPNYDLYRNSASPAASDILGTVNFYGEDSAGNKQLYGRVYSFLEDPTSTSEDGRVRIEAIVAGSAVLSAEFHNGQVLGSPSGSFKGDGTINAAAGVYDNGVRMRPAGDAKAWVRFNGTGTPAVVVSENLDGTTPLVDNNVGDYTINFNIDFASATSYGGEGNAGTGGVPSAGNAYVATPGVYAAGSCRVLTHDNNLDAVSDAAEIFFSFYGTQ